MLPNVISLVPMSPPLSRVPDVSKSVDVNIAGGRPPPQTSPDGVSVGHSTEKDIKNTDIEKAVSYLNEYIQSYRRDLHFSVDDDSGRIVVKVIDRETNEIIRQIPSEEAMALANRMEKSNGILLQAQA
ncbi:MAG: flagellar protein FlaG [Pseudomonadota bacterium]